MRILHIDDNEKNLTDFSHHMKALFGAEVFTATTLAEGLEKRTSIKRLDAIVLDLSFPDATREEAISAIPLLCEIAPTWVLSGHGDAEMFADAKQAGARECYIKGESGSDLAKHIAAVVFRSHPERRDLVEPMWRLHEQSAKEPRKRKAMAFSMAGLAIALTCIGFVGGWTRNAFTMVADYGAKNKEAEIHFKKLDTDVNGLQAAIKERQTWQNRMDMNIDRIMTKLGIPKARENE